MEEGSFRTLRGVALGRLALFELYSHLLETRESHSSIVIHIQHRWGRVKIGQYYRSDGIAEIRHLDEKKKEIISIVKKFNKLVLFISVVRFEFRPWR